MNHFSFVSGLNKIGRLFFLFSNLSVNLPVSKEMKSLVVLSIGHVLVLIFVFGFIGQIFACDTKWIRFVYMMSCGKKKRESVSVHNETFYENLPEDFDGALKYFKDNDPYNPMFSNEALLYEFLEEYEETSRLNSRVPKLLLGKEVRKLPGKKELRKTTTTTTTTTTTAATSTTKKSSILLNKLFQSSDDTNHLGIPGFPDQWDIDDIVDEKINDNHRRQIDQLIEECCKIPPVKTCNGNTFAGACK